MKQKSLDIKYLIILYLLAIACIVLFWAHWGNVILDCGREVFYPEQILKGKVLYKDLFNIYGPLSYQINALLFKIFGAKLQVLYMSGAICAFLIPTLLYFISKRFLSEFLSFSIAALSLLLGVLNVNLFNFIFPYSYAMLYGFVAILLSLFCLLKFQAEKDYKYLYVSSFFFGFAVSCKYEFVPFLLVFLYVFFHNKISLRNILSAGVSFFAVPFLSFGVLFLQGLNFGDLVSSVLVLKKIAQAQTLKYFYATQGVYFTKHTLPFLILTLAKTFIPFFLLCAGAKQENFVKKTLLIVLFLISSLLLINPSSVSFLPLVVLGVLIYEFKKISKEPEMMILFLASLLLSLKVFWGVATLNYGLFSISLLLISFSKIISMKGVKQNLIACFVIMMAFVLCLQNFSYFKNKDSRINTPRGLIYSDKQNAESTNMLLAYIAKNTKKTDKIVIFPEGLVLNFLAQRDSDNYYNSLIPLYIEVFGEKQVIEHFKTDSPDYIVFNNWSTKDYYFEYICKDYAQNFCSYVSANYKQVKVIDTGFRYLVFKKK